MIEMYNRDMIVVVGIEGIVIMASLTLRQMIIVSHILPLVTTCIEFQRCMEIELESQDTNEGSQGGHGQADEVESSTDLDYNTTQMSMSR